VASVTTGYAVECPAGWTEEPSSGVCYKKVGTKDWEECETACDELMLTATSELGRVDGAHASMLCIRDHEQNVKMTFEPYPTLAGVATTVGRKFGIAIAERTGCNKLSFRAQHVLI
jgi:hypothetical protein